MSRTMYQNRVSDPANIILRWRAKDGVFRLTDLFRSESMDIHPPLSFIVLDELQAIRGFSVKYNASIYSNMCRGNEPGYFKVRVGAGGGNDFPINGQWGVIKDKVKAEGGRWVKVIYALMKVKVGEMALQETRIVKIELSGLALANYMQNIKNPYVGVVAVDGVNEVVKNQKFYVPKFATKIINGKYKDEIEEIAKQKDVLLQSYLNDYFKNITQENNVLPADNVNENVVKSKFDGVDKAQIFFKNDDNDEANIDPADEFADDFDNDGSDNDLPF